MTMSRLMATATAALLVASPAQAAPNFDAVSPAQMQGAITYFLPLALEGVSTACASHLAPAGYVRTRLPAFTASFSADHDRYWPDARSAFQSMAGGNENDLTQLSDKALRPLLDEMIAKELTAKIKPSSCGDIERMLEALAPLNASQLSNLLGTIVSVIAKGEQRTNALGQHVK